jgi:hypothetical protein
MKQDLLDQMSADEAVRKEMQKQEIILDKQRND